MFIKGSGMCMKCELNDDLVVDKIEKIYNANRQKYKLRMFLRACLMLGLFVITLFIISIALHEATEIHTVLAVLNTLFTAINTYLFIDLLSVWTAYRQIPKYVEQYRTSTDGVKTFILAYLILSFNTVDFGSYVKILLDSDNIPEEFKELLRRMK